MAMNYRAALLALAVGLSAAPASADDGGGAYVFVSAGQSVATNACKSGWITLTGAAGACSEKSIVYRAGYGFQFTPMWGLELNYGQFAYASADGNTTLPNIVGPANYAWHLRAIGLALQGTVTLHMGDDFSVFGKFGMARVEFDERMYAWNSTVPAGYTNFYYHPVVNAKRNAPALGAGVQFDVGPHGSIRLMVESFGSADIYSDIYGPTSKVRLMAASLGLMYRY